MKIRPSTKAQSILGFTLLELLIVLFLLSLGYASLYSAGLGSSNSSSSFDTTVSESREIVRYARLMALAKGRPIGVKVGTESLQLFESDSVTSIPSPHKVKPEPYTVESKFLYSNSGLTLSDNSASGTFFYFDAEGRIFSYSQSDQTPLAMKSELTLSIENESGVDVPYLIISNVTGELMRTS